MRWLAAMALAAAGVLAGLVLRERLCRRVRVLQQLCLLFRQTGGRIAFLQEPFPLLVRTLADSELFSLLTFLPRCAVACADGVPFPQAWRTAADAFLRACPLRGEIGRMLPQIGSAIAAADAQQAQRLLEMYTRQAQADLDAANQTCASAGRLCVCVCAASGVLLGILIV